MEARVGPIEAQVGPIEARVGPIEAQVGPFKPQDGSFQSWVSPTWLWIGPCGLWIGPCGLWINPSEVWIGKLGIKFAHLSPNLGLQLLFGLPGNFWRVWLSDIPQWISPGCLWEAVKKYGAELCSHLLCQGLNWALKLNYLVFWHFAQKSRTKKWGKIFLKKFLSQYHFYA